MTNQHGGVDFPTIDAIRANRARLGDRVITTPVRLLIDDALGRAVGETTHVWLKEELFQRTGSFKPRGAFNNLLSREVPAAGVVVAGGGSCVFYLVRSSFSELGNILNSQQRRRHPGSGA